jgi:hypothetical protein
LKAFQRGLFRGLLRLQITGHATGNADDGIDDDISDAPDFLLKGSPFNQRHNKVEQREEGSTEDKGQDPIYNRFFGKHLVKSPFFTMQFISRQFYFPKYRFSSPANALPWRAVTSGFPADWLRCILCLCIKNAVRNHRTDSPDEQEVFS